MVGVSHYFKTPENYYEICKKVSPEVNALFNHATNPVMELYNSINNLTGLKIRAANYNQQKALFTRAMQWASSKNNDGFMLKPHDDICQVFCDRNNGWEIMDIRQILAVNFYVKATSGEGKLRVFNFFPNEDFLEENPHLIGSGYPYPTEILDDVQFEDVAVESGDLIILNGKFVHAVTEGESKRLILNSFIGSKKNSNEVIYWS